jgi:hypothetical protein
MIVLRRSVKVFFFVSFFCGAILSSQQTFAAIAPSGVDCSTVTASDCQYFDALSTCDGTCITDKAVSLCGSRDYAPTCVSKCTSMSKPFVAVCVPAASTTNTTTDNTNTTTSTATCATGFESQAGVCFPTDTGLPDPEGGIMQILGNFFSWLLAIFGILAVGAFIISGVQYLVSAGDDDMIKTAKRNMTWSLVGVIVGLSGWVIMQAVNNALNANPFF